MADSTDALAGIASGIPGLDEILNGGLVPNRIFLVEGRPGAGKTTLSLQFLLAGASAGEKCMYITLAETRDELRTNAASHGWSLDRIDIREYIGFEAALNADDELTMFRSSEIELSETMARILADIQQQNPHRLVIDSLSEFRLLSETALRYRRQLLALKRYFADHQITVLLLDDQTDPSHTPHSESVAHGIISLEQIITGYGSDRRRLRVRKMRGRAFRAGLHDYAILTGGMHVFPRLIAAEHHSDFERVAIPSGLPTLDALLGGGPQAGTSTLLIGPAGCGKTTVAMQYVAATAARKQRASVFMFDELRGLLVDRMKEVGLDLEPLLASNMLSLRQVDPTELSPGEFAAEVRRHVDEQGTQLLVIDSLNGYLNAMPHEEFLPAQLHELFTYLGQRGVATLWIVGQQGIVGAAMPVPVDASYLADSVILFRYFEASGTVRKAISVTKKRGGTHENTIRELFIDGSGVRVGRPLLEFRGILTGIPEFIGVSTGEMAGR